MKYDPTDSRAPALTLETLLDVKRSMTEWAPEINRIVVGSPHFEPDRIRRYRSARVLFIGDDVVAAITRMAEGHHEWVAPDAAISLGGIALERWGSRPDHVELARAYLAELSVNER